MSLSLESLSLRFEHSQVESTSVGQVFGSAKSQTQLWVLDQTLLPHEEKWLEIKTIEDCIKAIKALQVRGAPLIGVVASLSLAQSALQGRSLEQLKLETQALKEARPTAVNLMVCMDRIQKVLESDGTKEKLLQLAVEIFNEDVQLCEKIAQNGVQLIGQNESILTHCNTGGLATAGVGTALGIIRKAHEQGKNIHVYVDETRPLLQGGRLTTWELKKLGIPYTLITDTMAASLMAQKKVHKIFVGCDRIAMNGDFANKIGTYSLAVLAHHHQIPFYVAGPYTTMDRECLSGDQIPIEQRPAKEVLGVEGAFGKVQWAPEGSSVYNPSFDVTPAPFVSQWVLDFGVFKQDDFKQGRVKLCMP